MPPKKVKFINLYIVLLKLCYVQELKKFTQIFLADASKRVGNTSVEKEKMMAAYYISLGILLCFRYGKRENEKLLVMLHKQTHKQRIKTKQLFFH